jgi:hypothetical protein
MFAAYSLKDDSKPCESKKNEETISWLKNTSFQQNIAPKTSVGTSSEIQSQTSGLLNTEESDNNLDSTTHSAITIANAEFIGTKKEYKKSSGRSSKKKKDDKQKRNKKCNIHNITPNTEMSKIGRKSIFSGGLQLNLGESFYEDLKGNKDNFAFPNMYFKNVAR